MKSMSHMFLRWLQHRRSILIDPISSFPGCAVLLLCSPLFSEEASNFASFGQLFLTAVFLARSGWSSFRIVRCLRKLSLSPHQTWLLSAAVAWLLRCARLRHLRVFYSGRFSDKGRVMGKEESTGRWQRISKEVKMVFKNDLSNSLHFISKLLIFLLNSFW